VAELWGLLADEGRLRVFAAITLGARSVLDIADHAGPEAVDAIFARRTEKLVSEYDDQLSDAKGFEERVVRRAGWGAVTAASGRYVAT